MLSKELADWDYAKISALGFVKCVPHFDATGTNGMKRSEHAEEMMKLDPSTPAIGVENDAALVIVGNGAFAVSGDGKVSHRDQSIFGSFPVVHPVIAELTN